MEGSSKDRINRHMLEHVPITVDAQAFHYVGDAYIDRSKRYKISLFLFSLEICV